MNAFTVFLAFFSGYFKGKQDIMGAGIIFIFLCIAFFGSMFYFKHIIDQEINRHIWKHFQKGGENGKPVTCKETP
jgi:ABC-type uncharacterized transport system permease subunit